MNGTRADLPEIKSMIKGLQAFTHCLDAAICPPATLLAAAAEAFNGHDAIWLGAQDCHIHPNGAHTGEISATMLADVGAKVVILGHSERRTHLRESNALVEAKTRAAGLAGLYPIVCVGETLEERQAGLAETIVVTQIQGSIPESAPRGLVVAYEPVWAIGTGLTPTLEEIEAIHAVARAALAQRCGPPVAAATRLLYGGSVKPDNAAAILGLPEVDGALVGGASLKAESFLAIVRAHPGC
jgi:triosephosphate isomerase